MNGTGDLLGKKKEGVKGGIMSQGGFVGEGMPEDRRKTDGK